MKVRIINCFNPNGETLEEKYLQIKHLKNKVFEAIKQGDDIAIKVNGKLIDIFDGEYEIVEN